MRIFPCNVWRSVVYSEKQESLCEWAALVNFDCTLKEESLSIHQCQQRRELHLTSTFSLWVSHTKNTPDYMYANYDLLFQHCNVVMKWKEVFLTLPISFIYARKSMKDPNAGCIHLKVTNPKKSCYKYTWPSYPACYSKFHPNVFEMGNFGQFGIWLEIYWYSA